MHRSLKGFFYVSTILTLYTCTYFVIKDSFCMKGIFSESNLDIQAERQTNVKICTASHAKKKNKKTKTILFWPLSHDALCTEQHHSHLNC